MRTAIIALGLILVPLVASAQTSSEFPITDITVNHDPLGTSYSASNGSRGRCSEGLPGHMDCSWTDRDGQRTVGTLFDAQAPARDSWSRPAPSASPAPSPYPLRPEDAQGVDLFRPAGQGPTRGLFERR